KTELMNGKKGPLNNPLDRPLTRSLFVITGKSALNPVLTLDLMCLQARQESIAKLKEIIYEKKKNNFKNFDANKLNLWKVNIPGNIENTKLKILESRSHNISDKNTTIQELGGEKLTPFDDFGDIFACSDLKNICIIVQPPLPATTTGPFQQDIPQAILSDGDIINILDPLIGEPPDPLKRTKKHINENLFEWPVERSDIIGIKNKQKEELIFIEGNGYHKRIKLPFLTLHEIYSNQNNHKLLSIRILDSLDNAISLNQNEKLTISFSPVFTVHSTDKQINEKNWDNFVNRIKTQPTPECIAYHNMQNAEFADSFLITEPFILIQDKQLIISRGKVIDGYSATMLEKGLVEKEHNKCKNVGKHIFLFVTVSKKRNDETYKENEILITKEESKNVFGDLLALRKLHCIEG
ncbi:22413_t:CDS:2, partial [Gigaspora margarita]